MAGFDCLLPFRDEPVPGSGVFRQRLGVCDCRRRRSVMVWSPPMEIRAFIGSIPAAVSDCGIDFLLRAYSICCAVILEILTIKVSRRDQVPHGR